MFNLAIHKDESVSNFDITDKPTESTSTIEKSPILNKSVEASTIEDDCNVLSPLETEILTCLLGQELYGLQICQAFLVASEGRRKMSIGTLYPCLARLERRGLVMSRMADRPTDTKGGARRKYFKITPKGSYALTDAIRFRNSLAEWSPI